MQQKRAAVIFSVLMSFVDYLETKYGKGEKGVLSLEVATLLKFAFLCSDASSLGYYCQNKFYMFGVYVKLYLKIVNLWLHGIKCMYILI